MSQRYSEFDRTAAIRCGLPIPFRGLQLYPIEMSHYDQFLACKDALLLRLGTLPVKYLSMDYFSALFAFEVDTVRESGKSPGLFYKMITLLLLSLRIEGSAEEFCRGFHYELVDGEPRISKIDVTQENHTESITPFEFSSQLRPLIAHVNGLELPDESENLDLVIANEQKKSLNAPSYRLNATTDALIASVAYLSGCRERDVMGWTVREFEQRKSAIDREKKYMLYGQAEMSGMVTFKKGNPAPSWCYDLLDESLGTQSLSELNFGDAKQKEN